MKSKKLDKKTTEFYRKLLLAKREELQGDITHISDETLKKSQKDANEREEGIFKCFRGVWNCRIRNIKKLKLIFNVFVNRLSRR